jgi:hypothetical protein
VNPGRRLAWDVSVGHEFPIVGWQSNRDYSDTGVAKGWGFGLWFPIAFHMIEDMGKDPSAPILDTDYRFSGQLKLQYGFSGGKLGKTNSHVGLRFQFGHESTHVGDEFTINATRAYGGKFMRVNVSYEYYDLAAAFEPNFGGDGQHKTRIRGGVIWLWHPDRGWYSEDVLLQPFGEMIARSRRNYEPYFGLEYSHALKKFPLKNVSLIASADIRSRVIYQYVPVLTHDEPTQVSVNLISGLQQKRTRIWPTLYLRYYHGVNPNGQFRSQSNYTLFGFGVRLGF